MWFLLLLVRVLVDISMGREELSGGQGGEKKYGAEEACKKARAGGIRRWPREGDSMRRRQQVDMGTSRFL